MRRLGALVLLAAGVACKPAERPTVWTETNRFATLTGAVCYEVFVRSFADSNGDGIGDLNGLTAKLDYIRGLGASCIWLMPVAASPSYHGYDVSDYYKVNPDYGTTEDFKVFVRAAHQRDIKVLVDMVLNHASSEHASFKAALADTASPYRSWYRFAAAPGQGPPGLNAWHKSPVRDEYYYGVFWQGMPDLNYDTPAVREEAKKVATSWLREMGVDGFRLDAVPYMAEDSACVVDCRGTHTFLHDYAAHLDSIHAGAYTVGEVWGNLEKLRPYYPDQLTSYFGFELADSLISAVQHESGLFLLDTYERYQALGPSYRWSPILSNHDGTRVMTRLGGDVAKAKLAATLLLTLPGLPFVYYGEEIGMQGDKPDERLRTPMPWSSVPGLGFSTGKLWEDPQPDWKTVNVATEDADSGSLLHRYRTLINLRKTHPALGSDRLVSLVGSAAPVIAYVRGGPEHAVLVVMNLGNSELANAAVRSDSGAIAPGTYQARNLLGGPDAAELSVEPSGRIFRYVPVEKLAPRTALILELSRR